MEQNLPLVAKKVWSLVRVMLFMLRKNICKRKLLLDLNMMMERGKVAGKALQNLMFHHHRNWTSFAFHRRSHDSHTPHIEDHDYEFSCSNTPAHPLSLFSSHKKHQHKKPSKKSAAVEKGRDEIYVDAAVIKALEMLTSATASPMLPGLIGNGKSPNMVRQLRITDSPYPSCNTEEDGSYVDEAAERFIMKFYNDLRRES